MAWYTVEHACTHEARHQLFGKVSEREWRLERMEGDLCPDCLKEKRDKEIAEENAKSAERAKEAMLPELAGSEKQIAWATTIRQGIYDEVMPHHGLLNENGKKVVEWFFDSHTHAADWIDIRHYAGIGVKELVMRVMLPTYNKRSKD